MPARLRASLAVLTVAVSVLATGGCRSADRREKLVAAIHEASRAASIAWPGYEPLGRPLLIVVRGRPSLLLGTTTYPAGFERVAWADAAVSESTRAFAPRFSYVRDMDLDGRKVAALLIEGSLDVADWTGYFIHERFHNAQFGGLFLDGPWSPYTVEDPRDVALAGLEGRRLADWVETGDPEAMRDFSALRDGRRRLNRDSSAERYEERMEGTAEFVDHAAREAVESPARVRRKLAKDLRRKVEPAAMPKWRSYMIGVALCRWLDEAREPRWREFVQNRDSPYELVRGRLALSEEEIDRRLETLTGGAGYAAAVKAATREIGRLRATRESKLAEFRARPGLRFVLSGEAASGSHSGPWLDYPDGAQLLSATQWSAEDPGFHIRLRRTDILRRGETAEFVLPPGTIILLDGRPWTPTPYSRRHFSSLSISTPPAIDLKTGPGRIVNDGKTLALELGPMY